MALVGWPVAVVKFSAGSAKNARYARECPSMRSRRGCGCLRSSSMLSQPRPRSCHVPLTMPAATRSPPGSPTPSTVGRIVTRTAARAHAALEGRATMASKPPAGDPVQDAPQVAAPQHAAAGLPAIGHTLRIAQQQMGVRRTALTLLKVNQKDGFDCPGCAWPEARQAAHRGVLRERREGGRRGGDAAPGHPGLLRRAPRRRPRRRAAATGWASRAASPSRCTCPRAPTATSR